MIQQKLRLSNEFKNLLKDCDEIWMAVAMISDKGFDFIQTHINQAAKQNYLVGIGLPTAPTVLEKLKVLNENGQFSSKIYHKDGELFHPKVYIIRHNERLTSFIGSGNCTYGGFEKNVEVSVKTDDRIFIENQLKWYNSLFNQGFLITDDFLNSYKEIFESRKDRIKKDKEETDLIFSKEDSQIKLDNIDFSQQFFKKEHYEAFIFPKQRDHSESANNERNKVRTQLYKLNDLLLPEIEKSNLDLHPHYSFDDIVSSAVHSPYTADELNGIWLHYGRNKNEIKAYGDDHTPLDYMRMQVIIHKNNIGVWNRVGKDKGSKIDRDNLRYNLKNSPSFRQEFFNSINSLPEDFYIELNNDIRYVEEFTNEEELTSFLLKDDYKNYFIIGVEYSPDDELISESIIVDTVMGDFKRLYPTYKLIKHNLNF
jgi:HKD family nuclease